METKKWRDIRHSILNLRIKMFRVRNERSVKKCLTTVQAVEKVNNGWNLVLENTVFREEKSIQMLCLINRFTAATITPSMFTLRKHLRRKCLKR